MLKTTCKALWKTETLWNAFFTKLMNKVYSVALPEQFEKCGKGVKIYYPFTISRIGNAKIGDNVHINGGAFINASGGLQIGNNVHIGRNLTIYTVNHDYLGQALPYDDGLVKKSVKIEDNVWIGINVTIIPGTTIGEGSIVGAGTTVSRDIPPLAIVGSMPPRIIKYRDRNHYLSLRKAKKYGGVDGKPYTIQD